MERVVHTYTQAAMAALHPVRRPDPSVDFYFSQVQDIEFTQIEMKVIEGLKIGNECLNKMHQVGISWGS